VPDPDRVVGDVLHVSDGVVTELTLHRPDGKNAFDRALFSAVRDELERTAIDDSVSVVLVTGAGDAFSAGADLREAADRGRRAEGRARYREFMDAIEGFPKPLVAAVNGVGVGIGCTMLLHCDLVLMAESARVRLPFVTLGLTTEASSSYLLPAAVGAQQAAGLLFTAGWMDAREAHACGLAWKVVPDTSLLDEARAVAGTIAGYPLDALVATKELLLAARADAVIAARDREQRAYEPLLEAATARRRAER
jgi:enoyl-CoA hydratase/carnithine racemase